MNILLSVLKLQSASAHFISAKHTTPVKKYVDDINFRLVSYRFFTHCQVSVSVMEMLLKFDFM